MTFLLDTNHAITHLNGHPRLAAQIASHKATGDRFGISTIVLGELYYGAYASQRTANNLAALAAFLATVELFEFDATASDEFGKIRAEQRAKGKPIPTADAQIAAVARSRGFTLLTDDAHFQSVGSMRIDNWLI